MMTELFTTRAVISRALRSGMPLLRRLLIALEKRDA
jgi:hypothetical protein